MKPRLLLFVFLLCPTLARAHIGSPDVFYDGMVGAWPTHITIRMPTVVPGRAEIFVQVQSKEPVTVSFTPISSRTAASNAPPAELGQSMRGETNFYTGDLWLMTFGAYSIEVRIHGQSGDGTVQIPVNSAATAQLPLPPWLGGILVVLGLLLIFGAIAIVGAMAGESTLPPGVLPGKNNRQKYWIAVVVTAVVLAFALVGGKKWWDVEERNFRFHLHEGGWPDLAADIRVEGFQRILQLTVGKKTFGERNHLNLVPDHGKLLHLFLVGLPNHQAFGHIHPVRHGDKTFVVALPPLPEGDYELFCDLTLESGLSSTATNFIHIPASPTVTTSATNYLEPDPDDSWASDSAVAVRENAGGDTTCRLPGGTQVIWKTHPSLHAKQDAGLKFEVRDANGQPANLEPYMGMMSHAAVLCSDGLVFAHLHPSGNYSMAAQMFFDAKMAKESGAANMDNSMMMPDGSMMMRSAMPSVGGGSPVISLPYEFPTPGDYRVWVQIRADGRIMTAIFDATVK
jgi:hypothetical protein